MRKRILLVDDDPDLLEAATRILEDSYAVSTATSGKDALVAIDRSKPDLIVLDVMMTHMSEGFDLSRKLKGNAETEKIPIVLLTGADQIYDTGAVHKAKHYACDGYLRKPLDPKKLIQTIEELLGDNG